MNAQPLELEDIDGEWSEAPIIQEEMVTDLLHNLDTGLWGWMKSTQAYRGSW